MHRIQAQARPGQSLGTGDRARSKGLLHGKWPCASGDCRELERACLQTKRFAASGHRSNPGHIRRVVQRKQSFSRKRLHVSDDVVTKKKTRAQHILALIQSGRSFPDARRKGTGTLAATNSQSDGTPPTCWCSRADALNGWPSSRGLFRGICLYVVNWNYMHK